MLEILEPILSSIKDLTLYAAVLAAFVVTAYAAVTSFGIWAAYKAVYWCAKYLSECLSKRREAPTIQWAEWFGKHTCLPYERKEQARQLMQDALDYYMSCDASSTLYLTDVERIAKAIRAAGDSRAAARRRAE